MTIRLKVNGEERQVDVDPDTPLLWVLRDELKLTGTKYGCGIAQCGACTVHVDGMAQRSCVTPVELAQGREITTIEGLSGDVAKAVQDAWIAIDVPQCGFCQSGQIMQATALLAANPNPTEQEILDGMQGNICRCGCYQRIIAAVRLASAGA
jgi:isoquinoline 1-oxidoreductase alpha subunit